MWIFFKGALVTITPEIRSETPAPTLTNPAGLDQTKQDRTRAAEADMNHTG